MSCYDEFVENGFNLLGIATEEERQKYRSLTNLTKSTCSLSSEGDHVLNDDTLEEINDARLEPDTE